MKQNFKKRILIAGGAGFIGSHLCKRLVHEGKSVICLDNLYTGNISNIKELLNTPSFVFIKHIYKAQYYLSI